MEVAEQDGGLRTGDDQNNEDKEQEAKHVVHLMGPGGQQETYLSPTQTTGYKEELNLFNFLFIFYNFFLFM